MKEKLDEQDWKHVKEEAEKHTKEAQLMLFINKKILQIAEKQLKKLSGATLYPHL